MASIPRRLLLHSRRCPSRISTCRNIPQCATQWQRPLSTTLLRYQEDESRKAAPIKPGTVPLAGPGQTAADPAEKVRQPVISASQSGRPEKTKGPDKYTLQIQQLSEDLAMIDSDIFADAVRQGKQGLPWTDNYELERDEDFEVDESVNPGAIRQGFWAEGEPSMGEDEDYYGDDLTSLGHMELEAHRELREYARLAAWELPLLHQLAKPFELPTSATPFRFRYTSYLGQQHPAANKVVVEFSASDMKDLTPQQKDKLIKLAGPRYNPSTDIIKMSCELYDTLQQNKRHLGDSIQDLLKEAKNGEDTFADVPFDFRHHKVKKRHEFPEEWIMTPERKKYLENKRQQLLKLDDEKQENLEMIDGVKVIDTSLPFMTQAPEPVMAGGSRGKQLR